MTRERLPLVGGSAVGQHVPPSRYPRHHGHQPDQTVHAHFFLPGTGWDWYVTEAGPSDDEEHPDTIFFGLVRGQETEYGYFSLAELEQPVELPLYVNGVRLRIRAHVERDRSWEARPVSQVKELAYVAGR